MNRKWSNSITETVCVAGSQIGNVLTFPIAALLCKYGFDGGWPTVFYVLGTSMHINV